MADQALNTEVTPAADTSSDAGHDRGAAREPTEPLSRREQRRAERQNSADTLRTALDKTTKATTPKVISRGAVETPDGEPPATEATPWGVPKYATAWKEQRRKALEAIATNEAFKDHWKELDGQLTEVHDWDNRRNWEIGQYRKQLEPIQDVLGQMSQQYQLQGMSLQQGLGQLWGISQRLAQDPDSTLAWLGSQFKPRNPAQAAQALAQAWGLNLGELAQGQPYVDPVVAKQLQQTQAELQRIQNAQFQQQQAAQQQQAQQLINHITAFETAKDASGNLKYPFATEVGQEMGLILRMGKAQSLEDAYEMATKYHPKAQEERQKAAEKAAREAAARKTTDAEQASAAARNVRGKPNGQALRTRSMDEAIALAEKQTYGKSR